MPNAPSSGNPTPPGNARPLVLLVDDDRAVLQVLTRYLQREALDIRSTTSPAEALALLKAEPFALLISDYEMPEMTGAQLAGHARRIRPETVRILLTGQRTLETAVEGINQGEVFRFIAKPFDYTALRKDVLAALERHRELVMLLGDHHRRERRERLRADLEAEYPGISAVQRGLRHQLSAEPRAEAAALGLLALAAALER
jgi:DNA-binding NtrC family response regulator